MKNPVRFGAVEIGQMPRIVAVLGGTYDECRHMASQARGAGADVLEMRADLCRGLDGAELSKLLHDVKESVNLPVLLTIRTLVEGGRYFPDASYSDGERNRLDLFRGLMPHIDAVDIELRAWEIRSEVLQCAKNQGKAVVVSYHDRQTPPLEAQASHTTSLCKLVDEAIDFGADIAKIAVRANNFQDVLRLSQFTAQFCTKIHLATISMGRIGTISRVMNPLLGSCLTYGSVDEKKGVAPGMIPASKLKEILDVFGDVPLDITDAEEIMSNAARDGVLTLSSAI